MQISKFNFRVVAPAFADTRYAYYHPEDEEDDKCLTTSKSMEVVIQVEIDDKSYGNRQILRRNDVEAHLEQLIRHAYTQFREAIEKDD